MAVAVLDGVRTYRMCAPNVPGTAKVARDMVAALLHANERDALVDVAKLLVSEVVANVWMHTKVPQLTVDATVRPWCLLVSVLDAEPRAVPLARRALSVEEGGRGLCLVRELADAWGTTWFGGVEPTGKSVWFELRDGTRQEAQS
ncbi:ATP-binding protein [Streptomyces sp. JJ66]|uniref:ATP-binding protein n=1 Tax=Streptomyces sp. JJ66 TaxID=2803843 RepID=UPI001C5768E1|nr:ATP-binding protein [Streptomyces sp. JJ66]MBW1601477.1 ATP-binding protein [Streptomyces sp. JJ66]